MVKAFSSSANSVMGLDSKIPYHLINIISVGITVSNFPEFLNLKFNKVPTVIQGCRTRFKSSLFLPNFYIIFKLFLRFVWGRTRLPRTVADFRGRDFVLQVMDKYKPPNQYLPEAYTCFFLLKMPRYTTKAFLKEKLTYAIHVCSVMCCGVL